LQIIGEEKKRERRKKKGEREGCGCCGIAQFSEFVLYLPAGYCAAANRCRWEQYGGGGNRKKPPQKEGKKRKKRKKKKRRLLGGLSLIVLRAFAFIATVRNANDASELVWKQDNTAFQKGKGGI